MKTYYFITGTAMENPLLKEIAISTEAMSGEIARISFEANFGRRWEMMSTIPPADMTVVSVRDAVLLNDKFAKQTNFPSPKTPACQKVLQLMDNDFTYSEALEIVFHSDGAIILSELERELNKYI